MNFSKLFVLVLLIGLVLLTGQTEAGGLKKLGKKLVRCGILSFICPDIDFVLSNSRKELASECSKLLRRLFPYSPDIRPSGSNWKRKLPTGWEKGIYKL